MDGLIELDAGSNKITVLPKTIGELQQLKTLNLGNNSLTTIPEEIAQIQTLKQIDLENNKIASLPNAMRDMSSLQYVYTKDNEFSEAELEKNKKMFGEEIITQQPIIKNNEEHTKTGYFVDTLDYLPDDIEKYRNLKSIDLIGEKIFNWNPVMEKLSKLPKLIEIKVDYYNFREIPEKYKKMITGIKMENRSYLPDIILQQEQLI